MKTLLRIGTGITVFFVLCAVARAETKSAEPASPAAAAESLTGFKLPDLKTASVTELAGLATQALTLWQQATSASTSESGALKELAAVKMALATGKTGDALASLSKLATTAKSIPGAEGLLQSSKQLVSAWALKQGFDSAKISGVLGALQKGDYSALATQAGVLLAKGGVTNEQKTLVNDVLGVFGVDAAKSGGAAGALKGLFGK